jgi:threonine 3-dehydrogenase
LETRFTQLSRLIFGRRKYWLPVADQFPSAIDQGFTLLKPGGDAALLGVAHGPFTFDWNRHIVFKTASVIGISGRNLWRTWYQARGLIRSGAVDLSPLVTHRYKMEEFDKAFETMSSGDSGKVMLIP